MEEPIIEVRRMRAAYGLADATVIGPKERDELARLLLSGKRAYDLESATYQAWRQKHEEQYMQWRRKRVTAASERRAVLRERRKQAQAKKRSK